MATQAEQRDIRAKKREKKKVARELKKLQRETRKRERVVKTPAEKKASARAASKKYYAKKKVGMVRKCRWEPK